MDVVVCWIVLLLCGWFSRSISPGVLCLSSVLSIRVCVVFPFMYSWAPQVRTGSIFAQYRFHCGCVLAGVVGCCCRRA